MSLSDRPWTKRIGAILALAAIAALAYSLGRQSGCGRARTHDVVMRDGQTVVTQLRALARLETQALRLEKIIDIQDQQSAFYGLVQSKDALLFVASGEVIVGVDLSTLSPDDIRRDGNDVVMRLPPPTVLSARLDETKSYVYSRKTELLAARNEALEGQARQRAIAAFTEAASDPATLAKAKATTESVLRTLAAAWGAANVRIEWQSDAPLDRL